MALRWKGLETGGGLGCSGVKYPCKCCPLSPSNFTVPNAPSKKLTCPLCRPFLHPFLDDGSTVNENYDAHLQCHHHDMHSDLNRLEREEELHEKRNTSIDYDNIKSKTKVKYDEDPEYPSDNSRNNAESLHFVPGGQAEKELYILFLLKELQLRGMENFDHLGTVELIREELIRQVIIERRVSQLLVSHESDLLQDKGIFRLIDAVPCLLHCENRVMLKIYKLLLVEGMNNADAGLIYPTINSKRERYKRFITQFEKAVNGQILGTEEIGNSATWRIPYEEKQGKKVVGDVGLNNMKMRKIMEKIDPLLIDIAVEEGKQQWYISIKRS